MTGRLLRELHFERIDLVYAHITTEGTSAVGSHTTPKSSQILQIKDQFRAGLSHFDPAISGGVREVGVVDILPVSRPGRQSYPPGFRDPVCPFLRLGVEDQESLVVGGDGSEA